MTDLATSLTLKELQELNKYDGTPADFYHYCFWEVPSESCTNVVLLRKIDQNEVQILALAPTQLKDMKVMPETIRNFDEYKKMPQDTYHSADFLTSKSN